MCGEEHLSQLPGGHRQRSGVYRWRFARSFHIRLATACDVFGRRFQSELVRASALRFWRALPAAPASLLFTASAIVAQHTEWPGSPLSMALHFDEATSTVSTHDL